MQLPPFSHSTASTSSSEHSPSPHDDRSFALYKSVKHSPLKRSNSSATPRKRREGSSMRRSDSLGGGHGLLGSTPYTKSLDRSSANPIPNPFAPLPSPQLLQPATITSDSSRSSSPRKESLHPRHDDFLPLQHTSSAFFQSLNSSAPVEMEMERSDEAPRRREEVEDYFPQHFSERKANKSSQQGFSSPSKVFSPQLPPTPPAESLAAAFLDREDVPRYRFESEQSLPSRNTLSASTSSYFSPSHRASGRLSAGPRAGTIHELEAMFDPTMELPPLDTLCSLPSIFQRPPRSSSVVSPSPNRRNCNLPTRTESASSPVKSSRVGWKQPVSPMKRSGSVQELPGVSRNGSESRNSSRSPLKRSQSSTPALSGPDGATTFHHLGQSTASYSVNPYTSTIPSQPVLTLSSSPSIVPSSSPFAADVSQMTILADSTPHQQYSDLPAPTKMCDSIFLLPSPSLETDSQLPSPHVYYPVSFQNFSLAFDPSVDVVTRSNFLPPQDDKRRDRRDFTYSYHPATTRIDETEQEGFDPIAANFEQEGFVDFCHDVTSHFHDGSNGQLGVRARRESVSEAEDARVVGNNGWIAVDPVGLAVPTPSYPRLLSRVLGWGEAS